jgi:hypothetical protein
MNTARCQATVRLLTKLLLAVAYHQITITAGVDLLSFEKGILLKPQRDEVHKNLANILIKRYKNISEIVGQFTTKLDSTKAPLSRNRKRQKKGHIVKELGQRRLANAVGVELRTSQTHRSRLEPLVALMYEGL